MPTQEESLFDDNGLSTKELFSHWLSANGHVTSTSAYVLSEQEFEVFYDILQATWRKGVKNGNPMESLFSYLDSFPKCISKARADIRSDKPNNTPYSAINQSQTRKISYYQEKYNLENLEQVNEFIASKQAKSKQNKAERYIRNVQKSPVEAHMPDGTIITFRSALKCARHFCYHVNTVKLYLISGKPYKGKVFKFSN